MGERFALLFDPNPATSSKSIIRSECKKSSLLVACKDASTA